MRAAVVLAVAALGGCQTSSDPADGGFFSGVAGIASGSYEAGVQEEARLTDAARERNTALRAEEADLAARIRSTEAELARARLTLLTQRDRATTLDPATRGRVNAVLLAEPAGGNDAARLADLQRLLGETRALSRELASLGG